MEEETAVVDRSSECALVWNERVVAKNRGVFGNNSAIFSAWSLLFLSLATSSAAVCSSDSEEELDISTTSTLILFADGAAKLLCSSEWLAVFAGSASFALVSLGAFWPGCRLGEAGKNLPLARLYREACDDDLLLHCRFPLSSCRLAMTELKILPVVAVLEAD